MSTSKVVRLSSDTLNFVELYRSYLIDLYSSMYSDAPESMLTYEVDKWVNASFEEIINRALYMTCHDLQLVSD